MADKKGEGDGVKLDSGEGAGNRGDGDITGGNTTVSLSQLLLLWLLPCEYLEPLPVRVELNP